MIICGTGHRPKKLGGYGAHIHTRLVALAEAALRHYRAIDIADCLLLHVHQPEHVISGMALGWDQALAQAAVNQGIPFTAAIPFVGQESRWPEESQQRYHELLSLAHSTITLDQGPYSAKLMQERNEYMVNKSTHVLALWNHTPGGTGNCVAYAQSVEKPIINLWQSWIRYK